MKRIAIAVPALIVLLASSLMLNPAAPATAQVVPPNRNAVSFSFAGFSGAPVYSLGASLIVGRRLDATLGYSFQSVGGVSGSLLSVGVRYHFPVTAPGTDVFAGVGLASSSATFSGFDTVNASGLFVSGGASIRLAERFTGYVSGSLYSLGGTSTSVIDLGVQVPLADRAWAQVGYVNFGGSGAPYLGVSLSFPP